MAYRATNSTRVTIADVAREAGVSSQTVSRVINNKGEIRPETRDRVLAVIEKLDYRPSSIARSLATQRTNTIGLVVPDIANPFWSEIARGIEDTAWEHGYHVFLCNTTEQPVREKAVLALLEDKRVDGVILAGSRLDDQQLEHALLRHPAAVAVNRACFSSPISTVRIDTQAGAYQMMRHLISRGHRHIGFLAGPASSYSGRGHRQGYLQALREAQLPINEQAISLCQPYIDEGAIAAQQLIHDQPQLDAIYCYNDLIALGALQACADCGINIPTDIAIAGNDDILLARLVTPALTTLHVDKFQVGTQAANLLFERIDGKPHREQVITPQLVVRASAP
jgi:LacI family transcriptional regulator